MPTALHSTHDLGAPVRLGIVRWGVLMACGIGLTLLDVPQAAAQVSKAQVENSIRAAQRFLLSEQHADGSWETEGSYKVGMTAMVTMALMNSGLPVDEPAVARGLSYLRAIPKERLVLSCGRPTYELSLMTMALATANQPQDRGVLTFLAHLIETSQLTRGENAGSWDYGLGNTVNPAAGDNSNGQFAVLALREAAHYGIPIGRETWEKSKAHWLRSQNGDGGWPYSGAGGQGESRGSMTVAGISSLVIIQSMLGNGDDNLDCCAEKPPNAAFDKGVDWMSRNFAVGHSPGGGSLLYYLYGLERAGRLSGQRFFGEKNDWFRAGAEFLVIRQNKRNGSWTGEGFQEGEPVLATTFSLLFLAKGMAPVVMSKLKVGPEVDGKVADEFWNRHPRDVHQVIEYITELPKWPKLLTWQVIETHKLTDENAIPVLSQSPILYLSSDRAPLLTPQQVQWLRAYLDQGGTLFASAGCSSADFEAGFKDLVARLYPESPNLFRRLPADHPLYRAEFLVPYESHEIWGVDFGCRTPIIYATEDLGCYWERWSKLDPPGRTPATKQRIEMSLKVGANVVAYVTGRQPPDKLDSEERLAHENVQDQIERGFLEVAKLRHDGGWDTAPLALRNLLTALNRQLGPVATTKLKNFVASDVNILNYPLLYMHGRQEFSFGEVERRQLREYLQNGGILFVDACCGATAFDRAFRAEMQTLFPELPLERIPVEHEIFSAQFGFDVREVSRRLPEAGSGNRPLDATVQRGEPFLEGITIDGELAVIYSKYDISCALEKQVSLICNGYVAEDALKIALNVVRYALTR